MIFHGFSTPPLSIIRSRAPCSFGSPSPPLFPSPLPPTFLRFRFFRSRSFWFMKSKPRDGGTGNRNSAAGGPSHEDPADDGWLDCHFFPRRFSFPSRRSRNRQRAPHSAGSYSKKIVYRAVIKRATLEGHSRRATSDRAAVSPAPFSADTSFFATYDRRDL